MYVYLLAIYVCFIVGVVRPVMDGFRLADEVVCPLVDVFLPVADVVAK